MKKIIALVLAAVMVLAFAACSNNAAEETTVPEEETTLNAADTEKGEGVMTYAEFVAAELDSEVVIETYVQAKQSWWEDKVTVYTQDADGAYFLYEMACTEEDNAKLVPGTKIKVTGFKSEWSGEVEITDATFEIEEGYYLAEAADVTEKIGTEELINSQNMFVGFKGMTIEAYDEEGNAFAYKNAEEKTDDLYFKASVNGTTLDFCIEYYLCNEETDVYKAVEALKVGDVVDMEGFLYWYEGANAHITSLTVVEAAEGEEAEETEEAVEETAEEAVEETTVEAVEETTAEA